MEIKRPHTIIELWNHDIIMDHWNHEFMHQHEQTLIHYCNHTFAPKLNLDAFAMENISYAMYQFLFA